MKTNTQTGGFGVGNLEALGSKIVGPKISVIKRWFNLSNFFNFVGLSL